MVSDVRVLDLSWMIWHSWRWTRCSSEAELLKVLHVDELKSKVIRSPVCSLIVE